MDREAFEHHLTGSEWRRRTPEDSFTGAAGGAACGDFVRISLSVDGNSVADGGFDATGCGSTVAAGSAAVCLVVGQPILNAARIGAREVAAELGGLSPGKFHAAELAADALHRALGAATYSNASSTLNEDRTLIAMSGGVDSAVAALEITRSGREGVGVTVELWADADNNAAASCCSAQAVRVARALAHDLGLPHFTLDLRDSFRAGVVQPFIDEHKKGLTPNPCIRCNGNIRLDAMLEFADRVGARDLATGHYARTTADGLLRAAVDPAKDQSYMLAALSVDSVKRMRFPLGELSKPKVRRLARDAELSVASKAESQDLCFLAGTGRAAFLAKHGNVKERAGDIVDLRGERVGGHSGHHQFTVGQRKGLGIAASEPLYVLKTDARSNTVTVGSRSELAETTVRVRSVTLHRSADTVDSVKLRYRARPLRCVLPSGCGEGRHRELHVQLKEPIFGAAPGQTAVFFSDDVVVGWGTIGSN